MKLRLRFLVWAGFVIVSYLVMQLTLRPFAHTFFFFSLLLAPISLLVSLYQRFRIQVDYTQEQTYVQRGAEARWNLILTSPLYQSLLIRETEDHLLEPKDTWHRSFTITASHTGPINAPVPSIWLRDPMGFFFLRFRIPSSTDAYVLPRPVSQVGPGLGLGEMLSVFERPIPGMDEGAELTASRLLRPGDPMKRIHWKLSSRLQQWVVREEEGHLLSHLIILLDIDEITAANLSLRDEFLDRVAGLKLTSVASEHAHLHAYLPKREHARLFRERDILEQLSRIPHGKYLSIEEQLHLEEALPHALYLVLTPKKQAESISLSSVQKARYTLAFHSLAKEETL